jgi:hypothetical protein
MVATTANETHAAKIMRINKETTPAHAYAWMLTEMLSSDYVDLTGNGPSSDDLGTYTKFNYTRTDENYTLANARAARLGCF